ncbi:MAG: hypothetical protein Q9178_005949 [Gyalolechia marmorata]
MDLPESSASTLQLVLATESEITESSTLGSNSWKGPLETDDYLRREAHLRDQALTRDGGISYWDFYAALGWKTYPSKHIALAPKSTVEHDIGFPRASLLAAEDIVELCTADEANLRSDMAMPAWPGVAIRVALLPDVETMQWHHAREEFLAQVLLGRWPTAKGAMAETPDGRRVWCIWTRTFGASQNEKVLNILRLFVEGETNSDQPAVNGAAGNNQSHSAQALLRAIAAILQAAQVEASIWSMSSVQFWNPSPISVLAAQYLDPSVEIFDRHDESISSLRWHGKPMPDGVKIDWVSNEKYGWC